MATSNNEILGRLDVDDVDAIMDIAKFNDDVDTIEHVVKDNSDTIFTWNYDKGERPRLDRLYEKAKTSQWNASTDLDWSIEVDPTTALDLQAELLLDADTLEDPTSPIFNWSEDQWEEFGVESLRWRLSQFLHGEQGALLCTAKIVERCHGSTPSTTHPPRW